MKHRTATGLFAIILLLAGNTTAYAREYSMNGSCLKAYDLILKLRFDEAHTILNDAKTLNHNNNVIVYLDNYIDFLEIIISEEEDVFKTNEASRKSRLSLLEAGNTKSPWHLYCLAQMNMQWAFARLKSGEYTTAAIEFNRSYRQFTKNKALFPDFKPNDAALGLLHVLIGSIPENYKWVAETLSFKGTVSQGTGELQMIFSNTETLIQYPFLKSEALFLLSFITLNFSPLDDETQFMTNIFEKSVNKALISGSPLLVYAASAYYLHSGISKKALELLENRPRGPEYFPFHYLEYLTGQAKLNMLDYSARLHFLRFVVNFKGKNFIKSAYQRLAWIELLGNNPEGYTLYMNRVKFTGNNLIDGDKQAVIDSENPKPPDIRLLKARLLFDGGLYSEALNTIEPDTLNFDNPHDKLERIYRLGRIRHRMGDKSGAVTKYLETLKEGAAYTYYFAANAALQLGNIYEAERDYQKAKFYYEKCLGLNYNEYRTSISQKAKAGISRIKKR